jgi:hypothetical protein
MIYYRLHHSNLNKATKPVFKTKRLLESFGCLLKEGYYYIPFDAMCLLHEFIPYVHASDVFQITVIEDTREIDLCDVHADIKLTTGHRAFITDTSMIVSDIWLSEVISILNRYALTYKITSLEAPRLQA